MSPSEFICIVLYEDESKVYHLFGPMNEGLRSKHYASGEEVKTAAVKRLKEKSTGFYEAGNAFIWRWNIAIKRNSDYVKKKECDQRGPASFWCRIHVPMLTIFYFLSHPYIYIYTLHCLPYIISCCSSTIILVGYNCYNYSCWLIVLPNIMSQRKMNLNYVDVSYIIISNKLVFKNHIHYINGLKG